jgi:hypothetical protein
VSAFVIAFASLRSVLARQADRLKVTVDTPKEFTLITRVPSPFPQHKGQPMWFGQVRLGKAYVSFHLMPLYMDDALTRTISAALKKKMQGKTCFSFKRDPEPELLAELERLTKAGIELWSEKGWA